MYYCTSIGISDYIYCGAILCTRPAHHHVENIYNIEYIECSGTTDRSGWLASAEFARVNDRDVIS